MVKVKHLINVVALIGLMFAGWGQGAIAGTLDDVKERGKIVAGVRFDVPLFGYVDENGKNIGFDIDLLNEIAARLGVGVELVSVTGKTRIPMLQSGKVDMLIAATTHTRKRDKVIDFSITYVTDGMRLLVKKGSSIRSHKDLAGKTVTTNQGSTNLDIIRKVAPEAKTLVYQEHPQCFLALRQGLADAYTSTEFILGKFAASDPDNEYEIVGPYLSREPIAMGVRQNDSEWRDTLNFTLMAMTEDGTFENIWNKWLGTDSEYKLAVQFPELWP